MDKDLPVHQNAAGLSGVAQPAEVKLDSANQARLAKASAGFYPEKSICDLGSVKIQLVLGIFLVLAACLLSYWSTLRIGFLLDDYLHVDYVARAVHGDWADFLHNFFGNWAGSDIMKSYRPMSSLSFFIDYVLWRAHSSGYHLTNILLLFACCEFLGLIVLELTGFWNNRLGAAAALWAGLLFAVYPLHPEAVAWAIGRVDLLCCLGYLLSVFCYLRFRLTRENGYLFWSVGSFLFALGAKEMAVTLPAVIAAAEILLFHGQIDRNGQETKLSDRVRFVAYFWIALLVYAIFRTVLLGAIVGGYGDAGLLDMVKSLSIFLDKASLLKIIVPANEEVLPWTQLVKIVPWLYALPLFCLALRFLLRSADWRIFAFLFFWAVVALLPTFQIWHIYPNLVGSRLFFISSAPLCAWIALAAFPAVDKLTKRAGKMLAMLGLLSVLSIFFTWSYLLQENLKPWIIAGKQVAEMRAKIYPLLEQTGEGKRILLLDLPTDYSGAGMITRPLYLEMIARKPFVKNDLDSKLLTIEPVISGSHEFIWPGQLENILSSKNLSEVLIWDKSGGSFVSWSPAGKDGTSAQGLESLGAPASCRLGILNGITGAPRVRYVKPNCIGEMHGTALLSRAISKSAVDQHGFRQSLTGQENIQTLAFAPTDTIVANSDQFHVLSDACPSIVKYANFTRIYPGSKGITVFLPACNINPRKDNLVTIDMQLTNAEGCSQCLGGRTHLVWSAKPATSLEWKEISGEATVRDLMRGQHVLWVGRYRNWTLASSIFRLGIKFLPGNYVADLKSLAVIPDSAMVPRLQIVETGSSKKLDEPHAFWQYPVQAGQPISIRYDCSHLVDQISRTQEFSKTKEHAKIGFVKLLVSKAGSTFDPANEAELSVPLPGGAEKSILWDTEVKGDIGVIKLPENLSPGVHQIRLLAMDDTGMSIGLPSEPITIFVSK